MLEIERRLQAGEHVATQASCGSVNEVLARIGDKWTVLLIILLGDGPKRFNQMRRMVGGISQRMLTLTLRRLERDGLVRRRVWPTQPPRVEYGLTTLGRSLRGPIRAFWGMGLYQQQPHRDGARALRSRQRRGPRVGGPRAAHRVHRRPIGPYAPTRFGSRQARSNGRRQACGAINW